MYATCLFCHTALGANESIEHFPVGRRLAFDAAKGRLWVVCSKCERWNLSPLEERWEAIEEAERAYRDTKKRVATDNVGLARLQDGTDLIRIGEPLRPEFAAWRYGDTFGRRRKRQLLITGATVAGVIGVIAGAKALAIFGVVGPMITPAILLRRMAMPIANVPRSDGRMVGVTRYALPTVRVSVTSSQALRVQLDTFDPATRAPLFTSAGFKERMVGSKPVHIDVSGSRAERVLSNLLPAWNGYGGSAKKVSAAVAAVEHHGTVARLLKDAPVVPVPGPFEMASSLGFGRAQQLTTATRLALEMMLHEDSERRALEGELHELELRWKEADAVAAIADSLTLPDAASRRLNELRRGK